MQTPRASQKRLIHLPGRPGPTQESAASVPARYRSVLSAAQSCGEYERLMSGVFEHYPQSKFKDSQMRAVTEGHEWFLFLDEAQAHVARMQNYSLYGYLPFAFVASHLLFAGPPAANRGSRMPYPKQDHERRQQRQRADNLVRALLAEMVPQARAATSHSSLVSYDVIVL